MAWFLDDPNNPPGGDNDPNAEEELSSVENRSLTGGGDVIFGDANDSLIDGGGGADFIDGGTGNDTLIGGDDDDTFVFGAGFGADIISDFDDAGSDEVDASGAGLILIVDFNALAASGFGIDSRNVNSEGSNSRVTKAVVALHGRGRTSESYFDYIDDAVDLAGNDETAIIAPQLLLLVDIDYHRLPNDTLQWSNSAISRRATREIFPPSRWRAACC